MHLPDSGDCVSTGRRSLVSSVRLFRSASSLSVRETDNEGALVLLRHMQGLPSRAVLAHTRLLLQLPELPQVLGGEVSKVALGFDSLCYLPTNHAL